MHTFTHIDMQVAEIAFSVCACVFLRCSTVSSRLAAYEVLVMLADSSLTNLQLITKELLSMHHQSDPSLTKEFDVSALAVLVSFEEFCNRDTVIELN